MVALRKRCLRKWIIILLFLASLFVCMYYIAQFLVYGILGRYSAYISCDKTKNIDFVGKELGKYAFV